MSEGLSEYQKDKFLKYLNDRLARKQSERKLHMRTRIGDLLKTEIAELDVIKRTFEKILIDNPLDSKDFDVFAKRATGNLFSSTEQERILNIEESISFRNFKKKLLSLPERGATTDYNKARLMEANTPNVSNAWTHVVPALVKYAKCEGKRSLLGRDKGKDAYRELEKNLHLIVKGLYGDGLLSQGASNEECLLALLNSLVTFKEVYPNWNDAYSAAYKVFVEGRERISLVLDKHKRSVEAELFTQPRSNTTLSRKTLLEKAGDIPISMHILMEVIQNRLAQEYPQVLTLPKWSIFPFIGTIAGCVGLASRLHFDVPEQERTSIEMMMRDRLQKRFPESEGMYENCYKFLTESLAEIPRAERGDYFFLLLGLWVLTTVASGVSVEKEKLIAGLIAEKLQNETSGFWQ